MRAQSGRTAVGGRDPWAARPDSHPQPGARSEGPALGTTPVCPSPALGRLEAQTPGPPQGPRRTRSRPALPRASPVLRPPEPPLPPPWAPLPQTRHCRRGPVSSLYPSPLRATASLGKLRLGEAGRTGAEPPPWPRSGRQSRALRGGSRLRGPGAQRAGSHHSAGPGTGHRAHLLSLRPCWGCCGDWATGPLPQPGPSPSPARPVPQGGEEQALENPPAQHQFPLTDPGWGQCRRGDPGSHGALRSPPGSLGQGSRRSPPRPGTCRPGRFTPFLSGCFSRRLTAKPGPRDFRLLVRTWTHSPHCLPGHGARPAGRGRRCSAVHPRPTPRARPAGQPALP